MPRPHRETDAALQALYDQVPTIPDCKGHCWVSCGPLEMSDRERQRLRQAGFKISLSPLARASLDTFWCEALGPDGRCQVYDLRPLVCRLWGAMESMPCPYGCRPERWLSDEDGRRLVNESMLAGGGDNARQLAELSAVVSRIPGMADTIKEWMLSLPGDGLRADDYGTTLPPEITSRRRVKRKDLRA